MHSHRLLFSLLGAWLLAACHSIGPLGKGAAYGDKPGPRDFRTVVIDAGHGGKDSGARARGLTKKTSRSTSPNGWRRCWNPIFG